MKKTAGISAVVLGLALSTSASAALIDRGNGLIYDSDQDLTWLQDANYAKTSGYDADGEMSWSDAKTWAENLSFGGYDDWRLPTITDIDNDGCTEIAYEGTDCGYSVDTSGSELAYMFYDILGNLPKFDTNGDFQSGGGLTSSAADGVTILNLQSDTYWSGTEYAPNTSNAWYFETSSGRQYQTWAGSRYFAWAVRDGDVASVPEPGTMLLLAAGLAGVAGARGRRC